MTSKSKSKSTSTSTSKSAKAKKGLMQSVEPGVQAADSVQEAAPAHVVVAVAEANKEAARTPRIRVTHEDFIKRLTEKLTQFDAHMILDSAMISAGIERQEGYYKKDQAREICLALIKRGGPAFSVGAGIYREVVGT